MLLNSSSSRDEWLGPRPNCLTSRNTVAASVNKQSIWTELKNITLSRLEFLAYPVA
jgi:hypothetical protein